MTSTEIYEVIASQSTALTPSEVFLNSKAFSSSVPNCSKSAPAPPSVEIEPKPLNVHGLPLVTPLVTSFQEINPMSTIAAEISMKPRICAESPKSSAPPKLGLRREFRKPSISKPIFSKSITCSPESLVFSGSISPPQEASRDPDALTDHSSAAVLKFTSFKLTSALATPARNLSLTPKSSQEVNGLEYP